VQRFRGGTRAVELDEALMGRLDALARAHSATPYMVLLAAFAGLLYRYSGESRMVIASPIANRTRRELEGVIGCFVNMLPLGVDVSGNPAAGELLARVRRATLGAFAHADVPFDRIVQELVTERRADRQPVTQVVFSSQEGMGAEAAFAGLDVEALPPASETTKFDLHLMFVRDARGARAVARYDADLFEAATVEQMLDDYAALLAGMAGAPERRILDLALPSDAAERGPSAGEADGEPAEEFDFSM
jgi:non-ribosomal peptide synthetase component F